MKTKAVMALAAIASVGLSACSPSSQMVKGNRATYPSQPATPHAYTVSDGGYLPNPAGQNASPYPSQNLGSASAPDNSGMPMLSTAELRVIGDQIFKNEGGGSVDKLCTGMTVKILRRWVLGISLGIRQGVPPVSAIHFQSC